MARREIKDLFNSNVVVHCLTPDEDSMVRNILHSYGFKWADTTPMTQSFWREYKDRYCIDPFDCRYCHIDYYKTHKKDIISAQKFLKVVDINQQK